MSGAMMAAEMAEQPSVLGQLVERFEENRRRVRAAAPDSLAGVAFVARGSSDHAAVFGRYLTELVAGRPAALTAPSLHTAYRADVDYSGYLAVALSQSGATPEIVTVCQRLRAAGACTVAIVNDVSGALADAAHVVITLDAGVERAVPATKTVTAQLLAVAAVLDDFAPAKALAGEWLTAERLFVVSRGLLYAGALEAALKIKESAGIMAEGISAADLRHGPIAAIDRDVPVLVLEGGGPVADDLEGVAQLVRARGAPLALCSARAGADLPLPGGVPESLAVIPATVRAQQLALALAERRGLDPDVPAGLAKVTETH
jgi:glucosamine--fructose-6-phosphate aminotransferase (isomerizing)